MLEQRKFELVSPYKPTGDQPQALEKLVEVAGGIICGKATVLAEGDAQNRDDIIYLDKLPLFTSEGEPIA